MVLSYKKIAIFVDKTNITMDKVVIVRQDFQESMEFVDLIMLVASINILMVINVNV